MPRIRGWKELVLYRPTKNTRYKNIDAIFTGNIDWQLIENHWREMMQLVLSIKMGKIDSMLILRKLGTYNRKNKLYLALQELGRVIRTIFLLEYVGDVEVREMITEMTNKVEAYHTLRQWTQFGSKVLVASNDAIEMEKAIKYNDLITNSIMLQNVIDMSQIIEQLIAEGYEIGPEDIARLSPYWTEHLKRFGLFVVNLDNQPEAIEPERLVVLKAA
jgi:TnpA family transposase